MAVNQALKDRMATRGLNKEQLSEKSGLEVRYIKTILYDGVQSINSDKAKSLCRVLECEPEDLGLRTIADSENKALKSKMMEMGFNLQELANKADIKHMTLKAILYGHIKNPGEDKIERLCSVLCCERKDIGFKEKPAIPNVDLRIYQAVIKLVEEILSEKGWKLSKDTKRRVVEEIREYTVFSNHKTVRRGYAEFRISKAMSKE